jgi:hypothetical protein
MFIMSHMMPPARAPPKRGISKPRRRIQPPRSTNHEVDQQGFPKSQGTAETENQR